MRPVLTRIIAVSLLLTLICALISLSACKKTDDTDNVTPLKETQTDLLGTAISITIYGSTDKKLIEKAFSIVSDIDVRMSANRNDSEISKIGQESGKRAVPVSSDTYALTKRAVELSEISGGAFDVTIGPVMELWKTDEIFCVLPQTSDISECLQFVDYKNIYLAEGSVMLAVEGMKLDLGAIAKGFACDTVKEYLKQNGVETALLDFGGNICAYGKKPDGSPWKLGIRSPILGESGIVCTITVKDTSVVTSGGYERYFEKNDVIYHHLLNPETGFPADSGVISVTIINASSTTADALSTACFVLGLDKGLELLESLPDTEGIFISEDYKITVTSGLTGTVTLTDERFNIK